MNKFLCRDCKNIFEAKPVKKEYIDPVFGPCSSNIANCPDCSKECNEYVKPKPQKASSQPIMSSCDAKSCNTCPGMN